MRDKETCLAEGRAFLGEMIAAGEPLRQPEASKQARLWCKSRGYAEWKFGGPSGWIITKGGLVRIASGRPL